MGHGGAKPTARSAVQVTATGRANSPKPNLDNDGPDSAGVANGIKYKVVKIFLG